MKLRHRYRVYAPDGADLGYLPKVSSWSYSYPHCDIPALNLDYHDGSEGSELLQSVCEVAVEVSRDSNTWIEPPNARFLRIKRSLNGVGPDKTRKYTMPGYGWLLNKMRQMKTTGLNSDGKRSFPASNAGMIMKTMIDEAKARGVCTGLQTSFTSSVDSSGAAWNKVITIAYEPGMDLFTILVNLSDQGICDWNFTGRTLNIYNLDTTLHTIRDLTLHPGLDIGGQPIEASLEDYAHSVLVLGDGGKKVTRNSSATAEYWGKWEGFIGQGGVKDTATMNVLADAFLVNSNRELVQFTTEMNPQKTRFDPYYDFSTGEYVYILRDDGVSAQYRIRAMNFARDAQGARRVDLVLNDRFMERTIRMGRRINGITGGASTGGSGTAPLKDPGKRKPKTPTGLVVSSDVYVDSSGTAVALANVQWAAVTQDVDDIDLEIERYEIRAKRSTEASYRGWGSTSDLQYIYSPVPPGSIWSIQVRAVSSGGTASAWSTAVSATMAADTTAPPKASDPLLSTRLGTLTVKWDGKTDTATTMPSDFRYLQVFRLGVTDPLGTIETARTPLILTDVVIGQSYEIFFKPVDRAGNVGVESDHVSITVAGIMADPEAALDINENVTTPGSDSTKITYSSAAASLAVPGTTVGDTWWQFSGTNVIGHWRWDGDSWEAVTLANAVIATLDAGKITTGTLAAARIASSAITADKIAAGAIDATKLSADAIDGKTITGVTITGSTITGGTFRTATTGARMQVDSSGRHRVWLADGTVIYDMNPSLTIGNNLKITGAIRTYGINFGDTSAEWGSVNGDTSGTYISAGTSGIVATAGTRFRSLPAYNTELTGASVGPLYISNTGSMGQPPSVSRSKLNVENYEMAKTILDLPIRKWQYKRAVEAYSSVLDKRARGEKPTPIEEEDAQDALYFHHGFLAEEAIALGLDEFMVRNSAGEVVSISYDRLWIAMLPVLKDHDKLIKELVDRVKELVKK